MSVFAPKQKGSLLDLSRRDNAQQGPSNGHRGPSNGHRGPHGNAALGQVRKNRQPRPLEFPDKVTGNNIAPWNIMSNREARTTVMLRNIPNKLGYFELRRIMESILHGRYDFLYMRVDFNNRCNVGYAFINFVEARDVLVFYHAVNDRTWTVFNTDKVAQVCYATIQGKDCLMERFRNSSVMTQWACMRARTFYSAIDRDQYNRPVNPRMYGLDSPFLPCNSKVKVGFLGRLPFCSDSRSCTGPCRRPTRLASTRRTLVDVARAATAATAATEAILLAAASRRITATRTRRRSPRCTASSKA
jgi:hypothetical protein